jgi:hypothetical protein
LKDGIEARRYLQFRPLLEQSGRTYTEWLCQLLNDRDCRVPCRAFYIANVGSVNACAIGKLLLAPALLLAELLEVRTQALANIHAKAKTLLSIINLQTIGDI